ncbi:MAG: hypothetical protein U0900_04170 [Myxococcota bacterium]
MLPLFAPLLFALLGLGALVVDGGLAFTEQARLDATAESLALEWSRARTLPLASMPGACPSLAMGSLEQERCLRSELLASLVEPLGLVAASDADGTTDSARALDGTPLAERGARLGTLSTAGVFEPAADGIVRLTRTAPLLFGWASIPATTSAGGAPLDFEAIRAARAQDGMTPVLSGTDLRARGFALEGQARLDEVGVPALRVGALIPGRPEVAGAVGIAWRLDALDLLAAILADPTRERTLDLAASAARIGDRIALGAVEVGCSFDPLATSLQVGGTLAAPSTRPLPVPARAALAYLPVVEGCAGPILGFVAVAYDPADAASSASSATRIALRPSDGRTLHRNASARPAPGAGASATAAALDGAGVARLQRAEAAWAPLVVRLPRLADAS